MRSLNTLICANMVDNPIYQGDRDEPMYESVPSQSQTTRDVIQQDNNISAKLNDDCNTKLVNDFSVVGINSARYVDHEFQLFRPTRIQSLNIQVHSSDTDLSKCSTASNFNVPHAVFGPSTMIEDVENKVFQVPQTSYRGGGTDDVDNGEEIVIAKLNL